MRIVMSYFWVALGGALGSVARFWCSGFVAQTVGGTFPWGTMLVNVVGSFIIGFVGTLTGPDGRFLVTPDVRTFIMVGFCGGYTTFSSFSLQTLTLAYESEWLEAGGNILLSVVLCLLSVWLGHLAASSLNQLQGA
jgi:CrcB protein